MMRRTLLLLASMLAVPALAADDDKVVLVLNASNDVKDVDAATVKNFYLGTLGFWDNGQKVTVYQRSEESEAAKKFFSSVLKMAPSRYRHHWQTQQLSGSGVEPETVGNAASVVARVAGKTGGVGYILKSEAEIAKANTKVRLIEMP